MDNINMKLRYQISDTTNLNQQFLINQILLKLKINKYQVVNETGDIIIFNRYRGLFNSRTDSLSKVDEGIFEVSESEGGVVLKLTYFISYLNVLIIVPILVLCGVFIDNAIFIFPLAIIIIFIARVTTLKNISRNLLKEMITIDC